ncbi:O-methyltransferase-domain-containing protein [Lasiosphaeris hirsuta]|uniref:O-methyltransferase-domain-containing protein n=1 Tax=Lasiosphaeris hirsuta TaxID=260670 RepID=A0AA40DV97_9PEZI|nr:O-methyltransferase-domain-containing protein [Lasiosphaeris hirsuta]
MPLPPLANRQAVDTVDLSIASAPSDIGRVPGLLNDITFLKNNVDVSSNREARLDLLEKARSLVQALETPRETMLKHVGAEARPTASFYCTTLGIEAGLFTALAANHGSPKRAPALSSAMNIDIDALPAPSAPRPSATSTSGCKRPTTVHDNPFTFGHQTPYTFFEFVAAPPTITALPVRGARAYYMHSVLHDWPDDKCASIIGHIKSAMTPGYSKLLINKNVIPSLRGQIRKQTCMDLYMMVMFGSRERTEEDWRGLLEGKCGLKICNIWNPGNGVEGIVECEVLMES